MTASRLTRERYPSRRHQAVRVVARFEFQAFSLEDDDAAPGNDVSPLTKRARELVLLSCHANAETDRNHRRGEA